METTTATRGKIMGNVRDSLSNRSGSWARRRSLALLIVLLIVHMPVCLAADAPSSELAEATANASKHSPAIGSAPEATKLLIDDMVARTMQQQQIPGYCLTITKDDRIAYQRGFGVCDLETKQPVTAQTVFGLASLTKTFTALTLLMLADNKQIDLDAKLSTYLPNVENSWKPLTIRQLASMTAGIPESTGKRDLPWKKQFEIVQEMPLLSRPGSAFLYSNYSYRTLGTVIERISGKPYLDVLTEFVLRPLGMSSTGTLATIGGATSLASGYHDDKGRGPLHKIEYMSPAVNFTAGNLFSNSDDLVKYTKALMNQELLSKAGYQTLFGDRPPLTTGKPSEWAFGWRSEKSDRYGRLTYAMNGGIPGVASSIFIFPDDHVAVIGLCNLWKPPSYSMAQNAAKIFLGVGAKPGDVEKESE